MNIKQKTNIAYKTTVCIIRSFHWIINKCLPFTNKLSWAEFERD